MAMKATRLMLSLVMLLVASRVHSQEQAASPYHAKVQFAGDLGLISVGAGRSFFQEKLETDLFLGYLPEQVGGDRLFTAALKATYIPFASIPIKSLDWQPLRTGLQAGYTFGNEYYALKPHDKYAKGYYGFSTALHYYFFLGGQVDFRRVEKLHRFGVYYEFGSNAEYIISYA
ncbi:hypothetical protein, partial [Pontibacter sp. HJ8]